jgi:RNA polymerase sigma factor (sigma-70 family)
MAPTRLPHLLRQLHQLLDGRRADGPADAELLRRFAEGRDEAAFEVLVWRHGPMVHHLCRRLLRRAADADDAFQATFLILVRKARSIARGASLAGWLYRVAYRVALEARAREARRGAAAYEDDFADPRSADDAERRELRRAVAEEVDRLPEKYRLPVVLCYLSGQTTEEAARRLGCPRGTVLSRLAAARRRLHGRLTRRGLAPTAGAVVAALGRKATARVPAALVAATVRAALWLTTGGSAGVSGSVLSLMEGALKAMLVKKLKWAAAILTAAALVGGGVGLWFRQTAVAEPPGRVVRYEEPAKPVEEPRPARAAESPRPVGTWEREVGPVSLTMRIEADRIYGSGTCVSVEKDGRKFEITLDADYSVTKDNVLYGVLTGVDMGGNVRGDGGEEWKEGLEVSQMLNDAPFSLRYRLDDNVLTIKELKFGDPEKTNGKNGYGVFMLGRWKKKADAGRDGPVRDGH